MEVAVRILLLLLAAYVTAVALGTRAEAQNYPWCAIYGDGAGGGGTNCGFVSFQQCMETARGGGGSCMQNPWYLQYGERGPTTNVTYRSQRAKRR